MRICHMCKKWGKVKVTIKPKKIMNIFKGWSKMDGQGRSLVITLCFISLGLLAIVVSPFLCFISWKIALATFGIAFFEVVASVASWLIIATFWKNTDHFNRNAK